MINFKVQSLKPKLDVLAAKLGPRVRRDEPLASYTAMRVGGPVDMLLVCESLDDLVEAVELARRHGVPWRVLGGGCNVLVADGGVRGLMILNRATSIAFEGEVVRAEAGAKLAVLAQETVRRGLAGLEWASGLPGTVGGAMVSNAGAFGGDVAGVLRSATVLEPGGEIVERSNEWFEFRYRGSRIKQRSRGAVPKGVVPKWPNATRGPDATRGAEEQGSGGYVVLAATFELQFSDSEVLAARADEIMEWRRTRHPSGATMGSTFKNPPGDHAGRLIEEAGLKGHRIGAAEISEQHANFFINTGAATAAEVLALIEHVRAEVKRQFGVDLELEIELVGW